MSKPTSSVLAAVTGVPREPLPGLQTAEPPPVPATPFSVATDPYTPAWIHQRACKGDPEELAEPRLSLSIAPSLAAAPRVGSLVEQLRGSCANLDLKVEIIIRF